MRVAIHEAVDKADGVVFRCTLSGSAADRLLEVPAWMFDRARCLDPSRLTASPFVSMDALSVLSDLLPRSRLDRGRRYSVAIKILRALLHHDQRQLLQSRASGP
jgi:hypothetical protein